MRKNHGKAGLHTVTAEDAGRVLDWILTRGGIAIWGSTDPARAQQTWSTPVKNGQGKPVEPPGPTAEPKPRRIITDPAEVQVAWDKEVTRFRVDLAPMTEEVQRLTMQSSTKVWNAVRQAGPLAHYRFDYTTQEAVIIAPGRVQLLAEWAREEHE